MLQKDLVIVNRKRICHIVAAVPAEERMKLKASENMGKNIWNLKPTKNVKNCYDFSFCFYYSILISIFCSVLMLLLITAFHRFLLKCHLPLICKRLKISEDLFSLGFGNFYNSLAKLM